MRVNPPPKGMSMNRRGCNMNLTAMLNPGCEPVARHARSFSAIICMGFLLSTVTGCQEPQAPDSQEPPTVTFANAWLKVVLLVI